MLYLIILSVVVVAMVLGPIMALKPNKTQKHQEQLREQARLQGLQVQVGKLPQIHRQMVRREEPRLGVSYRLKWQHPELEETHSIRFDYLVHRYETEPYTMPAAVIALLQKTLKSMPESIIAIECSPQWVAVYWQERGDTDTVKQIATRLHGFAEALQQQPLSTLLP